MCKQIPLGMSNLFALIDYQDFERVSKYKWYVIYKGKQVYARRIWQVNYKQHQQYLHNFILGTNARIDHKNRYGLDCTRENLRIATAQQNAANGIVHSNSKSGIRGVSQLRNGKWRAGATINQKSYNFGHFNTIEEATHMYNTKMKEIHGEFACVV